MYLGSSVTQLGFDETSRRKGHQYVTVAVDLEQRRVLLVVEGKDAKTIEEIKDYLVLKKVEPEQIAQASIDLSPAFISGIKNNFPQAEITFDRFHVVKLLNEAMNKVRQQERREHDELKGHKYTFLRNQNSLSESKKASLDELITLFPTLGEAYRLKTLFNDLWDMPNKQAAKAFIEHWCEEVEQSKIQPFMAFSRTVKSHLSGIVNFVETHSTNAILESINNKIQMAKRRARGFLWARSCPELSDIDFVRLGLLRSISAVDSGCHFLQTNEEIHGQLLPHSTYFKSLNSFRRTNMLEAFEHQSYRLHGETLLSQDN